MNPIWDATTTEQPQRTGQVHTTTDGAGEGCGCGCGDCSGSTSSTNRAADLDTDASLTGGSVADTIQSLAAPGDLSTEDALLIWTALNTVLLAAWAYSEVSGA